MFVCSTEFYSDLALNKTYDNGKFSGNLIVINKVTRGQTYSLPEDIMLHEYDN